MNLSNIQIPKIKISIRVIAVVIAIIGLGFLIWASNNKIPEIETETASLETENKSLAQTEMNLSNLYNNMAFYLEETDRLNIETEEILDEFPTFMYLEDKILYADTLLKTDFATYNISSFSYGQSNYVTSVSYGEEELMELYSVAMSGKYTDLTYTEIKDILDYGLSANQRFVITSLSAAYNEDSGYLNGNIDFKTYFIPGQTTPYEFPQSVVVGLGNSNRVDDLFGARQNRDTTTTTTPEDTPDETEDTPDETEDTVSSGTLEEYDDTQYEETTGEE